MKLGVRPRNLLLSIMGAQEFALIKPHLERVSLEARTPVETTNAPVSYAYFPEDCLMSVIVRLRDGKAIEASVVGREGMTGTAILLNDDMAPNDCRVQIAGAAWRIGSAALRSLLEKSPTLRAHLLRYIQVLLVQTSQTALANSHLTLEKRLARWLLMVHDRVGRDEFGLTHEFLAAMLGAGVVLGDDLPAHECYVQLAGAAYRLPTRALLSALSQSPTLKPFLLRYVQALHIQTGYTALVNARSKLEERLARWLLMCDDRVTGEKLTITHEFLSIMLGVRRPGVTVALQILEGKGFIRANRGEILLRDREGLIELTDGAYSEPEAEYLRLVGEIG
jgi:CRP-like cAMP-binding protein